MSLWAQISQIVTLVIQAEQRAFWVVSACLLFTCRDENVPPKVSNVLGFSKAGLSLKNENNAFTSISTDAANAVAADASSTSVQENWCYVLYSIV